MMTGLSFLVYLRIRQVTAHKPQKNLHKDCNKVDLLKWRKGEKLLYFLTFVSEVIRDTL